MNIHPTAIVHPDAQLGSDVEIGPHSVVDRNVLIGDRVRIANGVVIEKNTSIGPGCCIYTGAVLGADPQDLKFRGEETRLEIGANTIIREYVTVNRGTAQKGLTTVGEHVMLMSYVHVAHDCEIGDHVILANAVNLAGHVEIHEHAVVGGIVPIHQFVRIGRHAMVGGGFRVSQDICPYVLVAGYPLRVMGLNTVGLARRQFQPQTLAVLKQAYQILFRSHLNISQATDRIAQELPQTQEIKEILDFIAHSQRGIVR